MERNHLHLYDDLDPLSIFSISNSAGIVTLEVPSSATMTVAGKSTFVGTDTCVTRSSSSVSISTLTLDTPTSPEFVLGGAMTWNATGGGHLYAETYTNDDWITFSQPVHLHSLQMTQIPWEGFGGSGEGAGVSANVTLKLYNEAGALLSSTTYSLAGTSWATWVTIAPNQAGVKKILWVAPGVQHWPSVDNIVIEGATTTLTDHTLDVLFDGLDASVAANAAGSAAETARATAAEAALGSTWATGAAAVAAADAAGHATLTSALTTETVRAQLAEAAVQAALGTEQARAEAAEVALTAGVSALVATEASDVAAANSAIASETARAQSAESAVQADEDENEARSDSAIDALQVVHGTSDTDLELVVNGTAYPDGSYESMWVANQPNHLAEPYANASEPAYFTFALSDQAGITQYDNISVSLTAWDVDEPSPTEIWLGNADPTDLGAGVKTLLGPLTGGNNTESTTTFVLTPAQIAAHLIGGGTTLYVIIALDSSIGSYADPWGLQLRGAALTLPTCYTTPIASNASAITVQTVAATAAELVLSNQLASIASNADPSAIDSLTEIVTHFEGTDNSYTQLLQLLNSHVVDLVGTLDTLTDPDLPPADPLLVSLHTSYLSSLVSASSCTGLWYYGTVGGQDGWTSLTNDYAQPDSYSGSTQVPGDQSDRGNSIVGTFSSGDGSEEAGFVHEGTKAWHFKRGYDSPGTGTPQTPNIEAAGLGSDAASAAAGGDGAYRDTFRYSFRFRAHQHNDGSRIAPISGKIDGTDRSSNYVELTNTDPAGLGARVYVHNGPGSGWGGSYVTIASGLAYDTWHSFTATMTHTGAFDDSWEYDVNGAVVHTSLGYFNQVRNDSGWPYENSTRLKFQPRHANYAVAHQGFYFDSIEVASWASADEAGTKSEYCADFNAEH